MLRSNEITTESSALPTGATGPSGRPSWSGLLRLSLVAVPVKAYPTRSSTAGVHFHQLHADCGQRINHQKRCPVHGPVENAAIVRGYQYARDQYVVVEPEELEKVRPAKDKALVLEQFVGVHQVDPLLFAGRSLYLFPDGVAARHPYGVLAEALDKADKWALGRVVLSAQRQLVLVRPLDDLLVLDVLHYPADIRPSPAGQAGLPGSLATAEEIQMTRTLIEARSGPCDWSRYRDETAEELTA
jgi:DNA end-binding protein Ku